METQIYYLDRLPLYKKEKPYMITFDVSEFPLAKTNHNYVQHNIIASDVRPDMKLFSLGENGFEFGNWQTSLQNAEFDDDETVRNRYYPEIECLMRNRFPDAKNVHIMAHLRRKRTIDFCTVAIDDAQYASPVVYAHLDFSPDGARVALGDYVNDNPYLRDRQFEVINVWRVTKGPNHDWPLAICDFATVDMGDVEMNDVIHKTNVGESVRFYFNENHSWRFLDNQTVDEVVLFRNTDSRGMHIPFAAHAAVQNTKSFTEAPLLRESIEIRVALFY